MNERIRELADQVLPNEKEFHQGDPKDWGYFFSGDELEKFAELVVKAEPVAWSGYDLDGMVEAFSRVIEAHHTSKHPFHDPIDTDARTALRILRGITPAMKAYTAPPQRKPLTEEDEIMDAVREADLDWQAGWTLDEHEPNRFTTLVRAIERAHGIKEKQ